MDRLNRTLAGCGLALLLGTTGCKSTHSSVPPGPGYANDGRKGAPVSFSSDPHMMQANANPAMGVSPLQPNGMPNLPGGQPPQYGTPAPNSGNNYGTPSSGTYGPPGSSGLGAGSSPSLNPTGGVPAYAAPGALSGGSASP